MRERPVLQVGYHVLDDAWPRWDLSACSMGSGVLVNAAWWRWPSTSAGWALPAGVNSLTRPTISRRHRPALPAGGECGVAGFGDLGVGRPATGLLVPDRVGKSIGIHAWSSMPTMAARTDRFNRAVMENFAPARPTAATTSAV